MKISNKILILTLLLIFTMFGLIDCSNESSEENEFGVEKFESEMKVKGYSFELSENKPFFSSVDSKTLKINDDLIVIYSYENNTLMEEDSKYISSDGYSYSNGKEAMEIEWIAKPHFYKRGNIIVNYIGEDEKIISDLKGILGEKFAGME